MPSPLGHLLAGLSVGIAADPSPQPTSRPPADRATRFALTCAVLAAAPDLDLAVPHALIDHFHRTATHSLTAVALVFIVSLVVTGKVTAGSGRLRQALVFSGAWGTHLLMDWLGADPSVPSGIQLFWPFSPDFYMSGVTIFPAIERNIQRSHFLVQNATAAVVEVAVGVPLVLLANWVSARRARPAEEAQS